MQTALNQLYQVPPVMLFVAVLVIAVVALMVGIVIGEVNEKRARQRDVAPELLNRDGSLRDMRFTAKEPAQPTFPTPVRDLRVRIVRREELN